MGALEQEYKWEAITQAEYILVDVQAGANPGQGALIDYYLLPISEEYLTSHFPGSEMREFSGWDYADTLLSSHPDMEQALGDTVYELANEMEMLYEQYVSAKFAWFFISWIVPNDSWADFFVPGPD